MPHNKNTDKVVKRLLPWIIILGFLGLMIYIFIPSLTTQQNQHSIPTHEKLDTELSTSQTRLNEDLYDEYLYYDQIELMKERLYQNLPFEQVYGDPQGLPTLTDQPLIANKESAQQQDDVDNPQATPTNEATEAVSIQQPPNQNAETDSQSAPSLAHVQETSTPPPVQSTGEFVKQLAIYEDQAHFWPYIKEHQPNKTLVEQLQPLQKLLQQDSLTRVEILYSDYVKNGDSKPENSKVIAVRGTLKDSTWIYFARFDQDGIYYYDYDGNAPEPSMDRVPLNYTRITSPFDPHRRHPISGRIRPHDGVDLKAPYGAPVHSTGDGIVSFAGWQHGYGRLVSVKHPNGYETRYAHMSAINVTVGDSIKRGAVVGKVGNSGISTGHHLHFEVRVDGIAQDPMTVTLPSFKPISRDYLDIWHFRAEQYQVAMKELTKSGYTLN